MTDTEAIGYVNSTKFLIDKDCTAYVAAATKTPQRQIGIVICRSKGPWTTTQRFDPFYFPETRDLPLSNAYQRAPTLASDGVGNLHVLWIGGRSHDPQSEGIAHQ